MMRQELFTWMSQQYGIEQSKEEIKKEIKKDLRSIISESSAIAKKSKCALRLIITK